MKTLIGTKFEHLTDEELSELAPVLNSLGDRYLHTYEDGTAEIKANPVYVESPQDEIQRLKEYLTSTDYCVIKCMELGVAISDAYPEIHQKRTDARNRINELEAQYGIN